MTARPSAYTVAGSSHQNPSGDAAWIAPTTTPHPTAVRIGLFFAGRLTRRLYGFAEWFPAYLCSVAGSSNPGPSAVRPAPAAAGDVEGSEDAAPRPDRHRQLPA